MFTKILFLALAMHSSLGAPSHGEPVLDALAAHHNIAVQDQSYNAVLPQVLGSKVVLQNNPIHFKTGYVGTPTHPISTGQVFGEHVETFAFGQQHAHAHAHVAEHVVKPHVETEVITQSVQVPVQTMQTVQVPSVQYQTVQIPIQVRKEIVQVEKPVPVPQPVPVEAPPKPFVKEAIYARPFQVTQNYVKTRITPLKEVNSIHTERPPNTSTPDLTTENYLTPPKQTLVDFTEEKLYYLNRKRKVVTRFIKIEEYYEADTTEEVGVSYSYGHTDGGNFDLRITRVFEDDHPILVKNLTTTTKVSTYHSPMHVVHEYVNDKLVHSFHAGQPFTLFQGHNASESHFTRFHSRLFGGAIIQSKSGDQLKISKYTEFMGGKEVEIEERIYALPEGHALFVEKRIRSLEDFSAFPENIEPVPTFNLITQNGKTVLVLTLTYDSTKSLVHGKNGVAVSETFGSDFASFLDEFKKYITKESLKSNRLKRSIDTEEESTSKMKSDEVNTLAMSKSNSTKTKLIRNKRIPHEQIQYHGKIYTFKKALAPKGYTPGGFLYRSDDGSEIKVEEEIISHSEGKPRNEYLRFSQVYVPRRKVKYEVSGLYGQSIDSSFFNGHHSGFQNYPTPNQLFNYNGFS